MQATCEKCGKTITPDDFRAGRYYLFWITPTIPSESLYLCQDCRGISWEEREALFQAWMERRESGPARKSRPARTKRAPRARASRKRTQTKPDEPSPKTPSPTPARTSKKRATKQAKAPKRANGKPKAQAQPRADQGETPWWEDSDRKHEKLQELAQMVFDLSR